MSIKIRRKFTKFIVQQNYDIKIKITEKGYPSIEIQVFEK